jgi:hypothetical protein
MTTKQDDSVDFYEVCKNGKFRFSGTANECFRYILRHQGQSFAWAVRYGRWSLKKKL